MNSSVLLLLLATMMLMVKASPLNFGRGTAGRTTTSNPRQNYSLRRYTATVRQLAGVLQTTWILLKEHVRIMLIITVYVQCSLMIVFTE